jgi:hypothetical protein
MLHAHPGQGAATAARTVLLRSLGGGLAPLGPMAVAGGAAAAAAAAASQVAL